MKNTRKTHLLQEAMRKSDLLIEALEAKLSKLQKRKEGAEPAAIRNNRLIRDACMSLLSRRSPVYPSAEAISEECGLLASKSLSASSINNRHREIHRLWRDVYQEIFDRMTTSSSDQIDEFEDINTSHLSSGDRKFIDDLVRSLQSMRHKNNILRQFIAENIPLGQEGLEGNSDLLDEIEIFLDTTIVSGFEIDDLGLRTTRRVPPGAIVMERSLLDQLRALVETRTKTSTAHRLLNADQ